MHIELSQNVKMNYLGINEDWEDVFLCKLGDLDSLFLARMLMLSKKYDFVSFDEFANKMNEYHFPIRDGDPFDYELWNLIYSVNAYGNLSNNRTFITYNDELSNSFYGDWMGSNRIIFGEEGVCKYGSYYRYFYDNIQMFKENQEGKWILLPTFVSEINHMVESNIIEDILNLLHDEEIDIAWYEIYDSGIMDDNNFVIKNNFENLFNDDNSIRSILNGELSEFDQLTAFHLNENAILKYFTK